MSSLFVKPADRLTFLCLFFILGIGLSSFFPWPAYLSWSFFIIAGLLILSGFKSRSALFLGLFVLAFCLGSLYYQWQGWHKKSLDQFSQHYNQEITFKGVVIKEPVETPDRLKLVIEGTDIPGRVLVNSYLYADYDYGDYLLIKGKIKEPAVFEDFDYQGFLAKERIYSVVYYPQIKLIAQGKGNWFYQKIFRFKDKLRKVIKASLRPPQSNILRAILLGDKHVLSSQLKNKLNLTGTRHIVAISGLHMIIMSQLFLFLFLALGLWRQQAFYAVLLLLFFYITMIGAPASAVRAGIMAGLLLLAQQIGRLRSSGRALVLTATLMLLANPSLLKSDVGFQLSFLATWSIASFKPILDKMVNSWPNYFQLRDILTMTLAAQLGVLPLLVYHFGRISLISPLANLLIVPFLPVAMLYGLILSFIGLAWLGLAQLAAYPLWLLLSYFKTVINWLAQLPFAAYQFHSFHWLFLLVYYLLAFALIRRWSQANLFVKGY